MARGRLSGRRRARASRLLRIVGLGLAATAAGVMPGASVGPASLSAQEPVPADTLPADSAAADTLQDSVRAFPARLEPPPASRVGGVYEWGIEAILSSTALSLLDFLLERAPGFTSLRATYFAGPHHLIDGVLGPGFVTVVIDGREVAPLDGGQIDLTRIALAELERILLRRRADGWILELTTLRHERPVAYSRVAAGTGEPDMDLIRGVFVNGVGRDVSFATAIDLLNVGAGERPSDRFSLWGKVSWAPFGGRAGVEVQYRSESLTRTVLQEEELSRRELYVHVRGDLAEGLQAEGWAGTSQLRFGEETAVEVEHGAFSLAGRRDWGFARLGIDVRSGDPAGGFVPALAGSAEVGIRILPGLFAGSSLRLGSWDGFDTSELYGGLRYAPGLGVGLELALEGATGVRGVPYPAAAAADTIGFDLAAGSAELAIGPVRLGGRIAYQRLDRQPLFGPPGAPRPGPPTGEDPAATGGDAAGEEQGAPAPGQDLPIPAALPAAEVTTFEGRFDIPVIPLGLLLEGVNPIRAAGFGRQAVVVGDAEPVFLPDNVFRGELYFHDDFFQGNLEVRMSTGMDRRTAMLTIDPASTPGEPPLLVVAPSRTTYDFRLVLRIGQVHIWWRADNLRSAREQDLPGLTFPLTRNIFGVKWEFLN